MSRSSDIELVGPERTDVNDVGGNMSLRTWWGLEGEAAVRAANPSVALYYDHWAGSLAGGIRLEATNIDVSDHGGSGAGNPGVAVVE